MSPDDPAPAVEVEPSVARQVFGGALPLIRRYAADLAERGPILGLIGPREPARLWTRHVLNCGLLAGGLPSGATVADVGSGAGLPGLVLAAARPDLAVTLIEPMQRRVEWLIQETERLGLTTVTVLRARAEDVPAGTRFDVVTARAVGALATLLPITAPLAQPGGRLLLMKGASAEQELAGAASVVRRLGLTAVDVDVLGAGMALEPTRVVRATVRST